MKHKQSPQNSTQVFVLPLALPLFSFPFSEALAFKSFFLLVSWKWCHLVPICPKSQWAQISLWFPFQFVLCFIFNITWNASGCCWSKQIALLSNCYHSQKNTRWGEDDFFDPELNLCSSDIFRKASWKIFFSGSNFFLRLDLRLETWDSTIERQLFMQKQKQCDNRSISSKTVRIM